MGHLRALDGIRVIDCGVFQAGPYAAAMLGDLGAEVIKIEERGRGDLFRGLKTVEGVSLQLPQERNACFEEHNRNKKSVAVNLRKSKGKEILWRLVERSDVLITNLREQARARMGMDSETLRARNSKLIYASHYGFGHKGSEAGAPSIDILSAARSGMMFTIGEPDGPPLTTTVGLCDRIGAIMLAYGIVTALYARDRFGIGQDVTSSMLGGMTLLQGQSLSSLLLTGLPWPRHSRTECPNPLRNLYRCLDNRWIALGLIFEEKGWPELCAALEMPQLATDPRFSSASERKKNSCELVALLDSLFATKALPEWELRLREAGDILFSRVNSQMDVLSDPVFEENGYLVKWDHEVLGETRLVGLPVEFSETPVSLGAAAPELGQHTEEVLLDLCGYSWEDFYPADIKDFTPIVARVLRQNPDAIDLGPAGARGTLFLQLMKALYEREFKGPTFGTSADLTSIREGAAFMEGFTAVLMADASSPDVLKGDQDLIKRFVGKFGEAELETVPLPSYNVASLIAQVAEKAGTVDDARKMADTLRGGEWETVYGKLRMVGGKIFGLPAVLEQPVYLSTVRGGKLVTLKAMKGTLP